MYDVFYVDSGQLFHDNTYSSGVPTERLDEVIVCITSPCTTQVQVDVGGLCVYTCGDCQLDTNLDPFRTAETQRRLNAGISHADILARGMRGGELVSEASLGELDDINDILPGLGDAMLASFVQCSQLGCDPMIREDDDERMSATVTRIFKD